MTTEQPELQVRIDRLRVDVECAIGLNGGPGTAGVERARDAVMAVVTPIVDELQTRIQVRHNTLIAAEQQIESLRADLRRALGNDIVARIHRSIADAEAGRTVSLGDFSRYADEERQR